MKLTIDDKNQIWFGTWQIDKTRIYEVISDAIESGYRYFDFADFYHNQKEIGIAFAKYFQNNPDVKRSDFFFQTKILHGAINLSDPTIEANKAKPIITADLQLDYVDSIMIHRPSVNLRDNLIAWQTLIELKNRGLVKHIGVSNFDKDLIFYIYKKTGVMPEFHQFEYNVLNQRKDRLMFALHNNIVPQAYSPLNGSIGCGEVTKIAKEEKCLPTQLIIAWLIDKGLRPIVKTSTKSHMKENITAVNMNISKSSKNKLDNLNKYRAFFPEGFPAPEFEESFEEYRNIQ